ncbi:hypothetical protein BN1012_Phect295 [Candidatus Phaeomarinobacter ectocarpi]|uniref:DUF6468 domain-containing protein n=1 Tax=Candidatus Phaeomarinibacter ectocarpi TaxID=1458461 RepID=X5MDI3_9HYPH|nr:DUF6468 domain-containing protein [Candidatus Phaeomarinobacter ectocarpi]CDO58509.1 hypothetical protein BN1012_Phect295 [Candidatus Phaeomarinobacter ectocarpi]
MSSFLVGLLIELVVGGLLVATIAYCFLLDRRLRALRDGEGDLKQVVVALDRATTRAQGAITDLRVSCDGLTRDMQRDLKKARGLADELALMVEAGDHIADRLGALSGTGGPKTAEANDTPKAKSPDVSNDTYAEPPVQDDPLAETGLAAALRQVR